MNFIKKSSIHLLTLAALVLILGMTPGRANAGFFDFAQGRVAEPGTSLYDLGRHALDRGLNGIAYATNGEGRVVKVQAKKMPHGELRVTIQRVYIPENYIAKTHDQTLEVERNWKNLEILARGNRWVGGYAILSQDVGIEAYKIGMMVEAELRRDHRSGN